MLSLCGLVLVCSYGVAYSSNILSIIPTVSKSHFIVFDELIKGLAKRGHNITVVTNFPHETPIENINEISVKGIKNVIVSNFSVDLFTDNTLSKKLFDTVSYVEETEKVLNSSKVHQLITSNSSFDLIILESFIDDVYLGIAYKFKVPIITLSTCYQFPWMADRFGIPANPSYVQSFFSGYRRNMSFYERSMNTFLEVVSRLFYKYKLTPKIDEIIGKHIGSTTPTVQSLAKNISLNFINTHYSFFGAEPLPPQIVDISGIHLQNPRPLEKELDQWMNESPEGVIYFSFGSMLRGATLPADKVKAFLKVFESLPHRVLWKWEDEPVEKLPKNVKIMKWLPQRDVLAHPKVKVFISHGGLLGTTEAVVSGVPILGIPMYGDQPNNVAALVENRVAVHVAYNNISVESLSYALNALLYDKSYRENAALLKERFLDRPMSPLDTAVYWTEYVIRHRGAPHLQSAAVHLTWYQYYLLDVIAACLATLIAAITIIYYIISACLRLMCSSKSTKLKTN